MARPLGVAILALMLGLAGVVIPVGLFILDDGSALFPGGAGGAILLAVGAAVASIGLWRGSLFGWAAALLVQGFQIAVNVEPATGAAIVLALLIPGIIVGYLMTPEVRRWCQVSTA